MNSIWFAILIWILPGQWVDMVGLNKTTEIQGCFKHYPISIQIYRSIFQCLTFPIEFLMVHFHLFHFQNWRKAREVDVATKQYDIWWSSRGLIFHRSRWNNICFSLYGVLQAKRKNNTSTIIPLGINIPSLDVFNLQENFTL